MTVAEIHGKISGAGSNLSERMEDLLTSDVFGCLRYLPPGKALVPFLLTARSLRGNALQFGAGVVRVYSAFWPWLKAHGRISCEPDVVLGLETEDDGIHLIAVEAKYYSDLSSEEDEGEAPNNQLARELDNLDVLSPQSLGWPPLVAASRALLFVTEDLAMPRADLKGALHEFEGKRRKDADVFWTSWRFLPSILEERLACETDACNSAVLEDLLRLLVRKGLVGFRGVEPVVRQFMSSAFEFYRHRSRSYRWPAIPATAESLHTYCQKEANRG